MFGSNTSVSHSSASLPELPGELLFAILQAAGRPLLCRQLSRDLSEVASQLLEHLSFSFAKAAEGACGCETRLQACLPAAGVSAVRRLVTWSAGLRQLDLSECAGTQGFVDDALIAYVLEAQPSLQLIDVSREKTLDSPLTCCTLMLFRSMPSLKWRINGCWGMHWPHPSLSAREVIMLQVLALRADANSGNGISTCFSFASPANQAHTGPVGRFASMIRRHYWVMLDARIARAAHVAGDEDNCTFLVVFEDNGAGSSSWLEAMGMQDDEPSAACFIWELSRRRAGELDGCWMTDLVTGVDMHLLQGFNAFSFMTNLAVPLQEAEVHVAMQDLVPSLANYGWFESIRAWEF